MNEYRLALLRLSATIEAVFNGINEPITCAKRCSACCFEPVYSTQTEVRLMLKAVHEGDTPFTMDELRTRVESWVLHFTTGGFDKHERVDAHEYRAAHIRCPMLHGKKDFRSSCGVYDDRPAGCRMHYTRMERTGCEDLEKRKHQDYVDVGGSAEHIPPLLDSLLNLGFAAREAEDGGAVVTDHLGVLLAQALDIPCPDSATRRADHIPARPSNE